MKALRARKTVFLYCGIVEVVYLVYLALYAFLVTRLGWVFTVDENCDFVQASWTTNSMYFISFMFLWTTYYLKNVNLVISSMTLGSWYFADAGFTGISTVQSAFKTAVTSSAGTISIGSIITAITAEILKQLNKKISFTALGCLVKILLATCMETIKALTKFSMIMHAFSGESFFLSAQNCFSIMKKHFVQGLITDSIGESMVYSASYALSLGVGFATWAWLDTEYGWRTLSTTAKVFDAIEWQYVFYFFLFLYVVMTLYPMRTIFLIAIIQGYVEGMISAPLGGLFMACVAKLTFNFVGSIVVNGMDSMFVCYAIGKENNFACADNSMYIMLGEIATGKHGEDVPARANELPTTMPPQAVAYPVSAAAQPAYTTAKGFV